MANLAILSLATRVRVPYLLRAINLPRWFQLDVYISRGGAGSPSLELPLSAKHALVTCPVACSLFSWPTHTTIGKPGVQVHSITWCDLLITT